MKTNPRNAGAKKTYKENVEVITLHKLIPKEAKKEILEAIDKIVEPYKN